MKNANTPINSPIGHCGQLDVVSVGNAVRQAVLEAIQATNNAVQKCLAAGQAMNEAREVICQPRSHSGHFGSAGDDGFMEWLARAVPEIPDRTARRWMRAAANVCRAIADRQSPDSQVIEVSAVLAAAEGELTAGQREWRQAWFDFTADKTIKECLAGVFVEGDEEHRVDRAMNGKFARGAGGSGDRKDFADFSLRKLRHLNTFFGSWQSMTERQRTEIKDEFAAAICGEEFKLRGRPGADHTTPVRFDPWPDDLCEVAMEAIRARLKGRN